MNNMPRNSCVSCPVVPGPPEGHAVLGRRDASPASSVQAVASEAQLSISLLCGSHLRKTSLSEAFPGLRRLLSSPFSGNGGYCT